MNHPVVMVAADVYLFICVGGPGHKGGPGRSHNSRAGKSWGHCLHCLETWGQDQTHLPRAQVSAPSSLLHPGYTSPGGRRLIFVQYQNVPVVIVGVPIPIRRNNFKIKCVKIHCLADYTVQMYTIQLIQ